MNKKLLITIALAVVLFAGGLLGFVVIPKINAQFKPDGIIPNTQTVSGNGGSAVSAGGYLYYIGNYVSTSTLTTTKQNKYNKETYGAIYRVKLDNGIPSYNTAKYDTEIYGDEQNIWTNNVKLIVPKIAGHENASLWIFDKYLVYCTPNNEKDKYGTLQSARLDFFRVDLDGRNHKKIYTMDNPTQKKDDNKENFTVVSTGGNIWLLVKDGEKLLRVSVNGKKPGKKTTITERVTSFAFPIVTSYNDATQEQTMSLAKSYEGNMSYVYYAESREDDDLVKNGNILKRYNINTGANEELNRPNSTFDNHEVLALANGTLLFEITGSVTPSYNGIYIAKQEFTKNNWRNNYHSPIVNQSGEKFFLPTEHNSSVNIIISLYNKNILSYATDGSYKTLASGAEDILAVFPSHIVYKTDTGICFYYYDNAQAPVTLDDPTDFIGNIAFSVFTPITTDGEFNNRGSMIFYIKTLTEQSDDEEDHEGHDHATNDHSTTVAAFMDKQSNEYLLCQLEETFLKEIEQE